MSLQHILTHTIQLYNKPFIIICIEYAIAVSALISNL